MITVVNKLTGEVIELTDDTPENVKDSWRFIQEGIKALEQAREKLKPKVAAMLDTNGRYDLGDYQFIQIAIQRSTYDKSVMRDTLGEDLMDVFLVPDKTALDEYLKDNLDILGDTSTRLRESMIAVGKPYTTIRLEKVKR